jgi:hypothetical protein
MDNPFYSPDGASRDESRQDSFSSFVLTEVGNQAPLIVEATLSVALREVFGIVLVDQFMLIHSAPSHIGISMIFRSPRRYSEMLSTEQMSGRPTDVGEALLLLETRVGNVLTDLFRIVRIDEITIEVNEMDQLACVITASVAVGALDPLDD